MAHIRKRGDTYSYIVHYGTNPRTGKPNKKEKGGFKSPKEAEKAATRFLVEIEQGGHFDGKDTVKGFLASFMTAQVKHEVSSATYEMQTGYMNNHIIPILGNYKLTKLTPIDIKNFYSTKIEEGLSSGTIHNISNLLNKALRTATEWGLINKNVMQAVRRPSYSPKKIDVWTQEQAQIFMSGTVHSRFHVIYVIALSTGMRLGEITSLQWKHIDLANSTISVQQTIEVTKELIAIKESPKTSASRRLITIPEYVTKMLRVHKLQQLPNNLDLVTPGIRKDLLYPSVLAKVFKADRDELKLPKIKFHGMRHTHATILLLMGVNPKVVQERLGHANISTTLNTYSHVLPSMQKETAAKLNDAFTL